MIKELLLVGSLILSPQPSRLAEDPSLTLYVSATGSDANDGVTDPVLTLDRVQEILQELEPQGDVEVRIHQGTYIDNQTNWHYRIPGHTITFMPVDYEYGEGYSGIAGRPVFRSDGTSWDYWFKVTAAPEDIGGTFGLRFYYLQVSGYAMGGMEFRGRDDVVAGYRVPVGDGVNGNYIFGMLFKQLGSKWNSAGVGYAGVVLSNSSDNVVTNNHFQYLENVAPYGNLIHGLYITHGGNRNDVYSNSFLYITADPAHTRNKSQDNSFHNNTFTRTGGAGSTGYYGEWFCDGTCTPPQECASHGNLFINNNLVTGYSGGTVPTFTLAPPGAAYAGPGCSLEGEPRVSTWGNI